MHEYVEAQKYCEEHLHRRVFHVDKDGGHRDGDRRERAVSPRDGAIQVSMERVSSAKVEKEMLIGEYYSLETTHEHRRGNVKNVREKSSEW